VRSLHAAPAQPLRHNPRAGTRAGHFAPPEVRRQFVDDYELGYEIQRDAIIIVRPSLCASGTPRTTAGGPSPATVISQGAARCPPAEIPVSLPNLQPNPLIAVSSPTQPPYKNKEGTQQSGYPDGRNLHPSPIRRPTAARGPPARPNPRHPTASPTERKHRGNPNLGLAPRCGARTRAGCPCRAPAIRGKLRCRMHGGRSTGPRTAEGLARLRAAHTIHGGYTAEARALNRKILTQLGRNRIALEAIRRRDRLLPELVARLNSLPPELMPPPWPTGGLTRAQDQTARQAEAANLAPWKRAIEAAQQATRRAVATTRGVLASAATALTKPHAPEPHPAAPTASSNATAGAPSGTRPERPHAPEAPEPRQPTPHLLPSATVATVAATPHAPEAPKPRQPSPPPSPNRTIATAAATPHAPETLPHFATTRGSLLAGTSFTTAATPPNRPADWTHALREPQPSRPFRQQQCRPPQ
jgi:hypothetical protein